MALNTKLLLKVKERILDEPEALDMSSWGSDTATRCGTVACIAGHAVHIATRKNLSALGSHQIQAEGRRVLNLTNRQADQLFMPVQWDAKFRTLYATRPCDAWEANAQLVADYIDHFIATRA